MNSLALILYGRKGCCLCEGLEQRLKRLSLEKLTPSVNLLVIDIDDGDTPQSVRERYDLEVPVMVIEVVETLQTIPLPRVSPRLDEEGLFRWLQQTITKTLLSH